MPDKNIGKELNKEELKSVVGGNGTTDQEDILIAETGGDGPEKARGTSNPPPKT